MSDIYLLPIQQQIEKAISILAAGGIVSFPTNTVYALGASVRLHQAVERIYKVKNRPKSMALPVLLANIFQIKEIADSVPPVAWLLARNFLPGALTLVLPKSELIPAFVTAGGSTVAVRVPNHPIPIALIEGLGSPVVGTSSNLTGKPSALTADEVNAQLGNKIDLIIYGGRCLGGRESTIVDVTGETPIILREGAISYRELKRICKVILYPQRSQSFQKET